MAKRFVSIVVLGLLGLLLGSCNKPAENNSEGTDTGTDTSSVENAAPRPTYVATIAPLGAILRELCGDHADVKVLLKPGASPHTYEPLPSDLRAVQNASAFFYVDDRLDAWATEIGFVNRIRVMDLVPLKCQLQMDHDCCEDEHEPGHEHAHEHEHEHEGEAVLDPHFWLDPCVVRDSLPGLMATLIELDPQGRDEYELNATAFRVKLDSIEGKLRTSLGPLEGRQIITAHPSFGYLCHEFGINVAMVVTDSPGKEPSPRQIEEFSREARRLGVQAIYSEPQISGQAAKLLAEASGIPIYELDPVGGFDGRRSYSELILYNAGILADSLH